MLLDDALGDGEPETGPPSPGLLLLGCGESAIRFSPPLVISRAQIDRAVEIFETAVDAATGS